MSVREVDGVRIEENTGRITAIEPKQRNAKVSLDVEGLKFAVAGWAEKDIVEHLKVGDVVEMTVERELPDGFRRITHIAPITTQKGSGGEEAQMADAAPPPQATGHGDASGGGDGGPIPAAERDVPNEDTQRFEGWAFVANVGMVDLAYEELSDALEAGELDSITPELLKTVAQHLLNAADQAQRALVGRADRGARSHTRARGVVRTALRKYPVRGALKDLDGWAAELTKTTTRLLQMAATL